MAAEPEGVRLAHDTLGPVEVPAEALFGAHTARARDNFAVGGGTLGEEPLLLRALAEVKAAAAQANRDAGALPPDVAEAIVAAAREVAAGRWNDEFPISVVQGGGGTPSNMNVNEVLAGRASQLLARARGAPAPVHPNDDVNRSQSTNDVYPTALSIAAVRGVALSVADVRVLVAALEGQARQAGERTRLGRTCLRDAMPVPIAAPLHAQATAVERLAGRLQEAGDRLLAVPLGATAVAWACSGAAIGTGIASRRHVRPSRVRSPACSA
jgi:aspartate ammonia-lyase